MAEKMASSEPPDQAKGQVSDEEHSDDGNGDASSTSDESIKATNDVRKPYSYVDTFQNHVTYTIDISYAYTPTIYC